MEAECPPEGDEPWMMREDEIERLLALELACDCRLEHVERLAAAAATDLCAA